MSDLTKGQGRPVDDGVSMEATDLSNRRQLALIVVEQTGASEKKALAAWLEKLMREVDAAQKVIAALVGADVVCAQRLPVASAANEYSPATSMRAGKEVVQELHIERTASRGLVGNVYLGRIVRIEVWQVCDTHRVDPGNLYAKSLVDALLTSSGGLGILQDDSRKFVSFVGTGYRAGDGESGVGVWVEIRCEELK